MNIVLDTNNRWIALDIDETLSWTIWYRVEEMQKKFGNPENLSVEEMAQKYRYTQNVPYRQSEEALKRVDEQIYSNETQTRIPPIQSAQEFVMKIHAIVPITAYITIRPLEVLEWTQKWLSLHGFPEAPIIMRPKDVKKEDGGSWKAKILHQAYPQILGIIDDNDSILSHLNSTYTWTVFLYDHDSSDKESTFTNFVCCKSWELVYKEIKERF